MWVNSFCTVITVWVECFPEKSSWCLDHLVYQGIKWKALWAIRTDWISQYIFFLFTLCISLYLCKYHSFQTTIFCLFCRSVGRGCEPPEGAVPGELHRDRWRARSVSRTPDGTRTVCPRLNGEWLARAQPALSPRSARAQPALSPRSARAQPALSPRSARAQPALSPRSARAQPALSPRSARAQPALSPRSARAQPALSPRSARAQPALSPRSARAQPALSPRSARAQPALSPRSVRGQSMVSLWSV